MALFKSGVLKCLTIIQKLCICIILNLKFKSQDMETDDSAPGVSPSTSRHTQQNPQHHRTGHNLVSEPDEDGWVTVVKNRK